MYPFALIVLFQLIIAPIALLAQSTPVNSTEATDNKRQLDEAAILKAQGEARKAQADADQAEANAAKTNLDNRKALLEMAKSTSSVEGNLVENNIAASKAIGCAAVDIGLDLVTIQGAPKPDFVLLYAPAAASALSEYGALRLQIDSEIKAYPAARKNLDDKLKGYIKKEDDALDATIDELSKRLAALLEEIKNLQGIKKPTAQQKNRIATLNQSIQFQTMVLENANLIHSVELNSSSIKISSLAGSSTGLSPAGIAIDAALNLFALFKTDTTIKGSPVTPGPQDLNGYLFRVLNLVPAEKPATQAEMDDDRAAHRPIRKVRKYYVKNSVEIISPDNAVLGRSVDSSALLGQLRLLSSEYAFGKKLLEKVDAVRGQVVKRAEKDVGKEDIKNSIEEKTSELADKLKKYGEKPSDLTKAQYEAAKIELALLNAKLEKAQKAIDQKASAFDEAIATEKSVVEALGKVFEDLSKRLTGPPDKDAANQKSLADYLRAEIIYEKLNKDKNKTAVWLETAISSNGANQMKKSSLVTDVFTRGPSFSYSGAAVVTYQIRNMEGTVLLAGTTWTYSPYRKASNISKFECRSTRQDGGLTVPFRNL